MNYAVRLDELINRVLDDLEVPDISIYTDRLYRYAFDAERSIGTRGLSYPRKEQVLDVINYRAVLPRDFFQLEAVSHGTNPICEYTGRDFRLFNLTSPYLAQPYNGQSTPTNGNINAQTPTAIKFNINSDYLNVTLESGQIGIAYYAMPIDLDGKVLIPEKHANAVSLYMQYKIMKPRMVAGKMSLAVYTELKNEWKEARNMAKCDDDSPTLPEMDMIAGIMRNQTSWPSRNTF